MEKYIKCEDLDNFFNREIRLYENCPDKYDAAIELKAASHIAIPKVEIKPIIYGKWEYKVRTIIGLKHYIPYCSVCGEENGTEDEYTYCPNCGARMLKE